MRLYQVGAVWYVELDRLHDGRRFRLRKSTGETRQTKAAAALNALEKLLERDRWDLLVGLERGDFTLRDLVRHDAAGTLAALPNADALRRLDQVTDAFIAEARSPHTATGRRHVMKRLMALKRDATLHDLPALVTLLRTRLMGKPRSFNMILMTARSLVKGLTGERSALYADVAAVKRLPYTAKKVRPFTRAELREIMDWLGPVRGRMLWTLCLTGMRPSEFFVTPWEVDGPLIRVHGTKTKGSDRIVPLVEEPVEAECSYAALRQHLAKYPGGRVRMYRTRHTFAHWCERARIPRTRIRLYLGHSSRDVSDDYLWHEVQGFVKRDAERLRALLRIGRLEVKRGTA